MERKSQLFLESVLGAAGAGALCKAVERSPSLEYALVPRALLAWVCAAPAYEGEIPGVDASRLVFRKSESGFTGSISVGRGEHSFEDHTIAQLSALVAIALDVPPHSVPEDLRDVDIERLGKSIDLLAQARFAHSELAKKSPPGKFNDLPEELKAKGYPADKAFAISWAQHNKEHKSEKDPNECPHCTALKKDPETVPTKKVEKKAQEGPGQAAAPIAPAAPEPPTASAPTPSAKPMAKPPKLQQVKLAQSEIKHPCPSCGSTQFRGERFVACMCFRDLQKNVRVVDVEPDGITLRLDWEPEVVMMFLESVGRK